MLRYYISKGLFAIDRATDLTLFIIDFDLYDGGQYFV